jgi:hypothetical protein
MISENQKLFACHANRSHLTMSVRPCEQGNNPSLLYAAMDCFARNEVWIPTAHDEPA